MMAARSAFGWSYPPGCSGPPDEPDNDGACWVCGAELPEDPVEDTPQWAGFCSAACEDQYAAEQAAQVEQEAKDWAETEAMYDDWAEPSLLDDEADELEARADDVRKARREEPRQDTWPTL